MTKAIISLVLFFAVTICAFGQYQDDEYWSDEYQNSSDEYQNSSDEYQNSSDEYQNSSDGYRNEEYQDEGEQSFYSDDREFYVDDREDFEDDEMGQMGGIFPIEELPEGFGDEFGETENGNASFAFPVEDMDGDSLADILIINMVNSTTGDNAYTVISVLRGMNGQVLWEKELQNAVAYAYPLGDVNADNCSDVMINVLSENLGTLPYSGVMAVDGRNGTEIWSRFELLTLTTIAYPMDDVSGDNVTDVMVHVIGIDIENESITTEISSVDGAMGEDIESREYPGVLAIEYPAGNMTKDTVKDHILGVYRFETGDPHGDSFGDSYGYPYGDPYENPFESSYGEGSISSSITAVDPLNRTALWNKEFPESLVLAWPCGDITDDGFDDLLFYEIDMRTVPDANITQITAVSGDCGRMIWRRGFGTGLPLAVQGPDFTGDGIEEFIVYNMTLEEDTVNDNGIMAVDGDSGSLLWNMSSLTTFLPGL